MEGVSAPTELMGMTVGVTAPALTGKKDAMICKPLISPNRQQTHM